MSWQLEEDFVKEYTNKVGNLIREDKNGQLHSLLSPALVMRDKIIIWAQNGKKHRLDGPAYEQWNGHKVWWYEDKCYGNSSHGYNQEKFLEDLKREGKI